jgi:hypothetical protein
VGSSACLGSRPACRSLPPITAVATCLHKGEDKGDEEAEYAWLPYHSIKPFALGDVSGNESGQAPLDPVLAASVVAADAALRAANAAAAASGKPAGNEDGSDSDGGWGVSREVRACVARWGRTKDCVAALQC